MRPNARLDFRVRARPSEVPEWMDGDCTYEDFRACLVDLAKVNRWTLAARPTLAFLASLPRQSAPLRIVDVGCGGGDTLRKIAGWARRRRIRVELTGIDLNPYAERAAKSFAKAGEEIVFITGDAYSLTPVAGIDVVLSSLMTHHLEEPEIAAFVRWMEATARVGWFVNDLRRGVAPYLAYKVLMAGAGPWHRFVRHDGAVSIRRGFREDDWRRMCAAAGVPDARLRRWVPGRLCVGRVKA